DCPMPPPPPKSPPNVALQCDVQRLFTHTATGATALALGVSVHPAFEGPGTTTDDNDLVWVKPWQWELLGPVHLWLDPGGAAVATTWTFPLPPAPTVAAAKKALDDRAKDLSNKPGLAAFSVSTDNPGAPPPAEGHVLQLQTAAARVTTDL